MKIIWSFAPFIAFAVFMRAVSVEAGLIAGAACGVISVILHWRRTHGSIQLLEAGAVALFGGLAIYASVRHPDWTIPGVRLVVDSGLMLLILLSIAVRRPFTLSYAREGVPKEQWSTPEFLKANDVISGVWGAAFAVMVLADLGMVYVKSIPLWVDIAVTVAALSGAMKFTQWYPNRNDQAA